MLSLLLLFAVGSASAQLLCQQTAPDQALVDALSVCRELDYPFCVDNTGSFSTELSARAVSLDSSLAQDYEGHAKTQSQTCMYHWRNMACSATFARSDSPVSSVCSAVCDAVREHCIGLRCPGTVSSDDALCTNYYENSIKYADKRCALREDDDEEDEVSDESEDSTIPEITPTPTFPGNSGNGKFQFRENFKFLAVLGIACLRI